MKAFLQSRGKADQKEKKSQAQEYQTNCSLVIGRHSHSHQAIKYIWRTKFKCPL